MLKPQNKRYEKYKIIKMDNLVFNEKIEKVVAKLACNGDYTSYHINHILAACYEVFVDAPVRWQKLYNSYPIPKFDIKKGFNGFFINPELIKWENGAYFFSIKKECITYALLFAVNNFKK